MDEMKDAAFTKGPWSIDPRYPNDVVGADGRDVAETHLSPGHVRPLDERTANARLIAAAPEMYEALKAARDYLYDVGRDKDMAPTVDKIAAALLKAQGR